MIFTKSGHGDLFRLHRDIPECAAGYRKVVGTICRGKDSYVGLWDGSARPNCIHQLAKGSHSQHRLKVSAQAIASVVEELEKDLTLSAPLPSRTNCKTLATDDSTAGRSGEVKIWVLTEDKQDGCQHWLCLLFVHDDSGHLLFQESMEANLAQVLQAYLADAKAADQQQDMALIVDGSIARAHLGATGRRSEWS